MSAQSLLFAVMESCFFSADFKHKTLDPREHKLSTNFHKWLLPLNDDESFIHFESMTFAVPARSKFSSHSFLPTRGHMWIIRPEIGYFKNNSLKALGEFSLFSESCSLPAIKFSSSMLSLNQIILEQFATRSLAIKLQILFYHITSDIWTNWINFVSKTNWKQAVIWFSGKLS